MKKRLAQLKERMTKHRELLTRAGLYYGGLLLAGCGVAMLLATVWTGAILLLVGGGMVTDACLK